MAYYRIYQSKDDIIETRLTEVFENMHRQVIEQKLTTDAEFFTCFFITTKENALLFQNCLKANVLEFFLGKIRSHTSILFCSYFQPAKLDPMLEYKMCFFAGGFLHIVRRWVEAGMEESIETMVRFSCGIVERLRQASSLS